MPLITLPRRITAALVLATLSAISPFTSAALLDDRVPADAMIYAGWAGTEPLKPQYNASNLKALLDAAKVEEFINRQLPALLEEAGIEPEDEDKASALFKKLFDAARRRPTAFYLRPFDLSDPDEPLPRFGLIVDAGTEAAALHKAFEEMADDTPPPPGIKFRLALDGTVLHASIGSTDTPADLKRAGGLAAAEAYVAAMNQAKHPTPAVALYVDVAKGIAGIKEALEKLPDTPPEAKERVPAVIEELGLNGVTQFAYTSGFIGKEWGDHAFLGIRGQPKGMLAMVTGTPLSDATFAMVPKDAVAFSAWKMDLHRYFTEIRSMVGKLEPAAQREMDGELSKAKQESGVDIDNDFFAALGDEWVLYRASPPEGGAPSMALVHKLRDGAKFARTIEKLESFANEAMKESPVKIEKISMAKTEVSALAFLQYSIAWTVKDGVLYVAPLDAIGGAIKQVTNKAPSILENESFKTARGTLPANAGPLMISYGNPAKIYPQLRVFGLGILPLLRAGGYDIPNTILPDPDDVAAFMTPGAGMIWSDAQGLHAASRTAFPGASLVSGEQLGPISVTTGAVGAGIMVPSLIKARELAARSAASSNARSVAFSCVIYASDDDDDKMPDSLARLVAEGDIEPEELVSKRIGTQPLKMTEQMEDLAKEDFAKFAAEVEKHSDFVYLGAGMKSELDSEFVILYERPGPKTTDGLVLGYADGRAEFVRFSLLPRAFERTNELLREAGKRPVDVGELLKAADYKMPPELLELPPVP